MYLFARLFGFYALFRRFTDCYGFTQSFSLISPYDFVGSGRRAAVTGDFSHGDDRRFWLADGCRYSCGSFRLDALTALYLRLLPRRLERGFCSTGAVTCVLRGFRTSSRPEQSGTTRNRFFGLTAAQRAYVLLANKLAAAA